MRADREASEIVELLKASGLPWRIENGSKHQKIFVGPRLAGILPKGSKIKTGRCSRNMVLQVRRAIRALEWKNES